MEEKNENFDPCDAEKKNNRADEVNTYDSPLDPLSLSDSRSDSTEIPRRSKKGILAGIYKFAAIAAVIMTVIFSASELLDFMLSDMGTGDTILKRVFGSSASKGSGDIFDMIIDQTFGTLSAESSAETADNAPESSVGSSAETPFASQAAPSPSEPTPTVPETPTPTLPQTPSVTPPLTSPPEIPSGAHPIIPLDMSLLSYGEDFIYNNTALSPDVSALTAGVLEKINVSDGPLVLVIHTHGTEAYMPEGATYYTDEGELARSDNTEENVIAVGSVFVSTLERFGIETLHCTVMHDKESYRESYSRSAETIAWYFERYPNIRYVFDIHRDSLMKSTEELISAEIKIGGKSYAQIMPVVGSGYDGYVDNLTFALKLRQLLNEKHGSLSRPVCLRTSQYNQGMAPVSVLLEMGTSGNTLGEAKRSAILTAEAIAELINEQIG